MKRWRRDGKQKRKGKKGGGKTRAQPSIYGRGSGPSSGSWQAAVGAWVAPQWRGAEGAALVTRERVTDVLVEVDTWSGSIGLSRIHTSIYLDDTGCPRILMFMFICTILFCTLHLLFPILFGVGIMYGKSQCCTQSTFVTSETIS